MKTSPIRRERELRRREGYRETVLHAAERVILRKGFSALTMDDVAREAQLSKATIYKYIAGKGVLIFEIMGHYMDKIRDRVAGIVDGAGTAGERLGEVIRAVLESGEDMKHVNRVLWMDNAVLKHMRVFAPLHGKPGAVPPADRKMMGMLRQKRQMIVDLGARIFEEGVASGEFRPMDVGSAADFLESILQGYMHMRFWQGDAPLPPAAAEGLTRFIIDGIRNPERSGKEN
jgi:AcrR family transcriptional regulator